MDRSVTASLFLLLPLDYAFWGSSKPMHNLGLVQWLARYLRNSSICFKLFKLQMRCRIKYFTIKWNRDKYFTLVLFESVQNRFTSFHKITYKFYFSPDCPFEEILSQLGLPSLCTRRSYFDKHFNSLLYCKFNIWYTECSKNKV